MPPKLPDVSPSKLQPLREVAFNQPTSIPGCAIMMTTVVALETRLAGGSEFICPQPYLDTTLDRIVIEDRVYPMDRVHFYVHAKMARSVPTDLKDDLDRFTIGRRRIVKA